MPVLEFVVISNDRALWRDVEVALAGTPAVRTLWSTWEAAADISPATGERIVVVDDEGCEGALGLVQSMRARERETQIIYLAARHGIELERAVRRVGVSYYADKAATGRDAMLAIEGILRAKGTWTGPGLRREAGVVQPGSGAREEEKGCAS